MKRLVLFVVIATVLVSGVWAGGSGESAHPSAADGAGEVTVALSGAPATLDPHKSFNGFVFTVTNQVYETLVHRRADGTLGPRLATEWRMVDDTTYEFTLREGVVFHDGTPFDAAAVKGNIERLLDPETKAIGSFIVSMISQIEVVDDYTLRLHTDGPFSPLPAHLSHPVTAMVSPGVDGASLAEHPVGTGPFAFASRVPGSSVRLSAFDEYWGGTPPSTPLCSG